MTTTRFRGVVDCKDLTPIISVHMFKDDVLYLVHYDCHSENHLTAHIDGPKSVSNTKISIWVPIRPWWLKLHICSASLFDLCVHDFCFLQKLSIFLTKIMN